MYSPAYSWPAINGSNDVELLAKDLRDFRVVKLRDKQATFDNIRKELELLVNRIRKGDLVYLHFSGHGQPIEDYSSDENDGWDESFVPYDAGMLYGEGGYTGSKHFTDDLLNRYITTLRKKLGKEGILYVTIDACYSGTMSRGENPCDLGSLDDIDAPTRGTHIGFAQKKIYRPKRETIVRHYPIDKGSNLANVIILEACGPQQKNTEIKVGSRYYGPLSYAVHETLKKTGFGKSSVWIENIRTEVDRLTQQRQQMVIETDIEL